jgi:hypothetical protein
MQVFTAAPSFQGTAPPTPLETEISKLLVVSQYKAVAELAVIRANAGGPPVPLHLTLVGQGSFANDPGIMGAALKVVSDTVKGHNVQVVYQLYNTADAAKLVRGAAQAKTLNYVPEGLLKLAAAPGDPNFADIRKAAADELNKRL